MQNTKINILSTRPLGKKLIDEAAAHNIIIEEVSFIETKVIENKITGATIDQYLQQNITVIFTSMNAVEAVVKHVKQWPDWKIYCIGNTTKKLVSAHFTKGAIAGTAMNAAELANVIIRDKVTRAVFFCGDQRRKELPEELKRHKVAIDEVVVYQTIETPVLIKKKYEGILFFSPSAVESFFSINRVDTTTQFFAVGSTTTGAIQQYHKNAVITPGLPGKENMVKAVMEYYIVRE